MSDLVGEGDVGDFRGHVGGAIGRAACRERVLRLGWMSVVARCVKQHSDDYVTHEGRLSVE